MADWYCGRHFGWMPCAHVVRWLRALTPRIPQRWLWFSKTETRESRIHGVGVFSTRFVKPGEVIARYHGREVDRHGAYVIPHKTADGKKSNNEKKADAEEGEEKSEKIADAEEEDKLPPLDQPDENDRPDNDPQVEAALLLMRLTLLGEQYPTLAKAVTYEATEEANAAALP